MPTALTNRAPQDLAAVLSTLIAVDWPTMWSPPRPGEQLTSWCARYGWTPQPSDRELAVAAADGARFSFYATPGGTWAPVTLISHVAWEIEADAPAENNAVLAHAAQVWPDFLNAARGVLGEPAWSGAWNSPGFPGFPDTAHAYWPTPDFRMREQDPHRMAYWRPADPTLPTLVLTVNVAFTASRPQEPGGAGLTLSVFSPSAGHENNDGS
ncbi:hypothetical protein [Streptomyces sp. H27-D2]|uniref:hypothetical protein n=1 Tax=Streptomyces sp. H27-D2 TaxID=3046304 RepID=UPI002DBCA2BC|nr:hypothetical protein [Streptomyces sp. H27-D2]MEC4018254.1 hypothetical protein [Streptomyces sp. H27-D2]